MIVAGEHPKGDVFAVARIARHPGREENQRSDPAVPIR
jgi:hypothetical protein